MAVGIAWGGAAGAHAFLVEAQPAVGARVARAPAEVRIVFSEGVETAFSVIEVTNAQGVRVDQGGVHAAGADAVAVAVTALPPGRYGVAWHVVAVDTHRTQGSYSFTVGR